MKRDQSLHLFNDDEYFVLTTKRGQPHEGSVAHVWHRADARRLKACWNACKGISTERLIGECVVALLHQQRKYLERLKHRADVRGGPDVSAMGIADEAIAHIDDVLQHRVPNAHP